MGRVWVLDTETKGTGAEMVPLDTVLKKPAPSRETLFVPPKRKPREPKPERWRLLTLAEQRTMWDRRSP